MTGLRKLRADGAAAQIGLAGVGGTGGQPQDQRGEAGQDALPLGLPQGHEAHGRLSEVQGLAVQVKPDDFCRRQPQTGHGPAKGGDSTSWTDSVKEWFAPQGTSGASTAGNVLSGVGTAVGIGSGLASMYYAKKEADLKKDKAKMEKDAYQRGVQREAEAENRMQQFAKNAGNGAFYK